MPIINPETSLHNVDTEAHSNQRWIKDSTKNQPDGVAGLDSSGKIDTNVIPELPYLSTENGGTVNGDINMGVTQGGTSSVAGNGHRITNLPVPKSASEPVPYGMFQQIQIDMVPKNHASASTTYGKGASGTYGHVKLSDSVTSSLSSLVGGTAATPAAVKTVYDLLGGAKIITGTATIEFGTQTKYVDVNFGYTFQSPPFVIAMQVFNTRPLCALVSKVTTTGCQFSLDGAFTSSGSRDFKWLAIGV